MRYSHPPLINPVIRVESSIYAWSIGKFLILIGTLFVALILGIAIIITYNIASSFLNTAYSRNAQVRALAQAHELNQLLVEARYELEFLSRTPLVPDLLTQHFAHKDEAERNRYREIAFQGKAPDERFVLINTGTSMVSISLEQALGAKFSILSGRDQSAGKPSGYVHIGEPLEVVYPSVLENGAVRTVSMHVLRLTAPVFDANKEIRGQLTLSVDLPYLRGIMSMHTSIQSPLFLFPQESEHKKSFFFDAGGWLLFQSESLGDPQPELSVDLLRVGLKGDVGRPGFNTAFRPGSEHDLYWAMVSDIQSGRSGQLTVARPFASPTGTDRTLYLSYVPIVFAESEETTRIVGGIGCFDASFVFMASTYQIAGMLTVCFGLSVLLAFLVMYFISRRICRPLDLLAEAVDIRVNGDDLTPVALTPLFAEVGQFQKSLNILLLQLQIARNDFALRENFQEDDRMRQAVDLEQEIMNNGNLNHKFVNGAFFGIVGGGFAVADLRQQIHKASRVMADVLIIGETGTGKELTAEAIHSVSHRAKGPFLSINCGALDENLLMDALFGHVKGAFSDAQTERKGAFIAASGGTLHLDEIGNASLKVQQALLRALSVRRIRPLGSDKDIAFDARIVAATNVDLLQSALAGHFREDLYYRLAVITINIPPLRQRKEDLPVLIKHYLEEHAASSGKSAARISRGALEKMTQYDWPGNIRELKNCLTRSLAFAESDLLLAEHILFDERTNRTSLLPGRERDVSVPITRQPDTPPRTKKEAPSEESGPDGPLEFDLNPRQRKAWPDIMRHGAITRGEYQDAVGGEISVRTAQYDLHDLVAKGVLSKSGRGPASRYLIIRGNTDE